MNYFKEYDVVRVARLDRPNRHVDGTEGVKRLPQIGDLGTIVRVYPGAQDMSPAYIVECADLNGFTVWLADFIVGELELVDVAKYPNSKIGEGIDEDTYSVFREGRRLLEGKNPYDRILGRDLSENANYAAYLPVSYLLSLISQIAGLDFFWEWLLFWRMVFLFFNLAIATSLFLIPPRQKLSL